MRYRDYHLDYPGGPNVIVRILQVEEGGKRGGQRDVSAEGLALPWLALMVAEGGLEPKNVGSLKGWKSKGVVSPLQPPGSMHSVSQKPMSDVRPSEVQRV